MSYLRCLCLRPTNIMLCFWFVCFPVVYLMLPFSSLNCPIVIAPLVFSNVYLPTVRNYVHIMKIAWFN